MASVGEKRFPAGRGMDANGGIVRRTRAPLADAALNKTKRMAPEFRPAYVAHNVRLTHITIIGQRVHVSRGEWSLAQGHNSTKIVCLVLEGASVLSESCTGTAPSNV